HQRRLPSFTLLLSFFLKASHSRYASFAETYLLVGFHGFCILRRLRCVNLWRASRDCRIRKQSVLAPCSSSLAIMFHRSLCAERPLRLHPDANHQLSIAASRFLLCRPQIPHYPNYFVSRSFLLLESLLEQFPPRIPAWLFELKTGI